MRTNIFMVRHAESPFIFGKERTRGLSDDGIQAARKVANVLKSEEIHFIASSPYVRAKQTVEFLAERKDLHIVEYEDLRERPIKGLDYKAPWEEILVAIEKSFTDIDFSLEGGESTRKAQERVIPVIKELLNEYKGENIVIGTHGNIMTIIMNYFDKNYGFDFWNSTSMPDIYKMTFVNEIYQGVERLWKDKDSDK